jgi:hypothetical protein
VDTPRVVEHAWTGIGDAASSRVDGGLVVRAGYGFYWETRVEPPAPALGDGFLTQSVDGADAIHRIMLDRRSRTYFGYDVVVAPMGEAGRYRVTFRPLTLSPQAAAQVVPGPVSEWASLPSPEFAPVEAVGAGEVLALELLRNGDTGQRIVDYVTVQDPSRRFSGFDAIPDRQFAFATGEARDFRAEDVELRVRAPRLTVNGTPVESTAADFVDVTGPFVWFYAPNRGRFVLSLAPRPELGFQRTGEVRGTLLEFRIADDVFALSSGVRIAPGQAVFNLYVLHDPAWKPTYAFADTSKLIMGSAPDADTLFPR